MAPLYRPAATGLLRAALTPARAPWWPDPDDEAGTRTWIAEVWADEGFAGAVQAAAPGLVRRVEEIQRGERPRKEVRKTGLSLMRYALRSHRPTPFALFAGAAPFVFGDRTSIRWGQRHKVEARPDAQWVDDVIRRLLATPVLLDRLPVVASNLASGRAGRLQVTHRLETVAVDLTGPVRTAMERAGEPVRFGVLVGHLAAAYTAHPEVVRPMLFELVRLGFLVPSLRPPGTVTDPLRHVVDQVRLHAPGHGGLVEDLEAVVEEVEQHNASPSSERRHVLQQRMREVSGAGRTPLALHAGLDCEVEVPRGVAADMADAASTLLRLAPYPRFPVWEQHHAAFLDRYGAGARVPLLDLVDPDTGLGYPSTYPGSIMPKLDPPPATGRDTGLLGLAHEAIMAGRREIVLDDQRLETLTGGFTPRVPPHVEAKARIHAPTREALDRGDYRLTVTPAYHAGVLTGRFADPGTPLAEVLGSVPVSVEGAIPAQVVTPPVYPHAENVGRVPRFAEHTIPIGEHTAPGTVIPLAELAVTADWGRMYLLWGDKVVEPAAFHALALEKQAPTLAQFLINLPRGGWTPFLELDWGPAGHLPYLPGIRRGRATISPERWRLTSADLPGAHASSASWAAGLEEWAHRWRLPERVELHHGDQALLLDLSHAAHRALLRHHLDQEDDAAILRPAPDTDDWGWCSGRPHEVAVPLLSTAPPRPAPPRGTPVARDRDQFPAGKCTRWVSAKVYGPRDRQHEAITHHLHRLAAGRDMWFIRYWDSREHDHLRVRVAVDGPDDYGACTSLVGRWAEHLRSEGLCRRLVLDTYQPETGRYGSGEVLGAAERVFVSDTRMVAEQLVHLGGVDPVAVGAAAVFHIAAAFLGSEGGAREWLIAHRPEGAAAETARTAVAEAAALVERPAEHSGWEKLAPHRELLAREVSAYRAVLPSSLDPETVLASLVHMHHNRWFGTERATERAALRVARAVALSLRDREDTQ
ncbi:lantibiotic dehydratase [Nocardiopsis sp. CNT-189]|uniref:lantibiotic dehydratase n=1 Tax=Nocardiopsis oceanisediminis TaxID=2816862 RepID=UPI003B38D6C4